MSRPRFNLMDFDLSPGFQVIEAGAGSGKTYNLVRIVLRLLTRPQNPLPIREILLVTFTEAAAAEMESRAMQAYAALDAGEPVVGFDAPPETVATDRSARIAASLSPGASTGCAGSAGVQAMTQST